MLGSMITDVLAADDTVQVTAAVRSPAYAREAARRLPTVEWPTFTITDAAETTAQLRALGPADWVINAIGLTKPYTHDDNPAEVERATIGNAMFPHWMARTAQEYGGRVLQIATDCVYSGAAGHYREAAPHDALDVYGKTKSLGEAYWPNIHHLRCSIIGPEPKAHVFLLAWFLGQKAGAQLNGFTNHRWNGVTTLHFAALCRGIVRQNIALPHLQHVIPTDFVSKYQLLQAFALAYGREDMVINPVEAGVTVDRTLDTQDPALNQTLWAAAGYPQPPTVPEMVAELARFTYRFTGMPQ
jgi:dTDP-4-dehydrorhamnose reductase